MTITQIKNEIAERESWLQENPEGQFHDLVKKEKRAWEHRLMLLDPPKHIANTTTYDITAN